MLKISVITITLNNFKTIEQTVQSVINQNDPNLEYIIIDGGSTDGTLEILNRYKHKFQYFKSSPDKGIYDAMNKGIAVASGDYIGFVNGGDLIYEKSFNYLRNIFSKSKNKNVFSVADVDYIDLDNNIVGKKICRDLDNIIKRKYYEMPSNHLGIFVPLDAFKKYGPFNIKFKNRADYHFTLKLMNEGYTPINLNRIIGAFRLGGVSGGYSTFKENYEIIKDVGGNFFIAIFSTFSSLLKLFMQKNFPSIYRYLAIVYYFVNKDLKPKEFFLQKKKNIFIHLIDFVTSDKVKEFSDLQKNLELNQIIIYLKSLEDNKNDNFNYINLNLKNNSFFSKYLAIYKLIKIFTKIKNKNIILHTHTSECLYLVSLASIILNLKHIHSENNLFFPINIKSDIINYFIYKSFDHIIFNSELQRYELLTQMPFIGLSRTSVSKNYKDVYENQIS